MNNDERTWYQVLSSTPVLVGVMGILIGLMGLLVAYTWQVDTDQTKRSCRNYRTLEALITKTPQLSAEALVSLGFSPAAASALVAQQRRSTLQQIVILGDPPEGCA